MGIAASELCRYVIRPTLIYLGRHSAIAESLLALPPASRPWVQPCMTAVDTASTESPNPVIRHSGTTIWHSIPNAPAWSGAWPANMLSSAARTSN